nr:hypothetical protein [Gemmatimonadota bacterium]
PGGGAGLGAERNLLLLLLRDEAWVAKALEKEIGSEEFRYPPYRAIFEGLVHTEGRRDPEGRWLDEFRDEALPVLEELRGDPEGEHITAPEEWFHASVRRMLSRPYEERLTEIQRVLALASAEDHERHMREKMGIITEMRERGLLGAPRMVRSAGGG